MPKRGLIFAFALFAAPAAEAALFPIDGAYGTEGACELLSMGGLDAVISSGGSIGRELPHMTHDIITPTDLAGWESWCQPVDDGILDRTFRIKCIGEGADWIENVVIHIESDTLTVTSDVSSYDPMTRCPAGK